MNLSGKYVVHELHTPDTSLVGDGPTAMLHANEIPGRNIMVDARGFSEDICPGTGMRVDAGTIEHRVLCVGYVFTEIPSSAMFPAPQTRRVVCLGDTSSAHHIVPLCVSDGVYPSLVVHESTNAWIPPHIDQQNLYGGRRKTPQSVREKAISKGHSTPDMAGAFARSVKAEKLALTHFSAMFKNPSPGHPVMREIARQATVAWGRRGANAIAAHDLFWIDIPQLRVEEQTPSVALDPEEMVWEATLWDEPLEPDQFANPTITKRKWDNETSNHRGGGYWKRGRGRGRGGRGGRRGGHVDTD
ncbi:hypothetical protein FS749_005496 [Ceratobasidium sp. UAMH 11750]|nr:hypothetical protein FS749_005496 [Ceratobasidium sp. UAMH 11750]